MAQGSNDLNMILKAQVVKIKVELDAKGSKLPSQVNAITKMLANNPVKLKVKLEAKIGELNSQIKGISTLVNNSKSFKPIKIGVEIDVKGSAMNIKKQLQDVQKIVNDFNKQYGQQLKQMQEMNAKVQKEALKGTSGANIKNTASVQNFNNIKDYAKQMAEAERILKSKLKKGESGLFSSFEIKDAKGNLQGFIATLEKANGVVEKVRYSWNKDKNQFQIVDRTTATQVESMVHKSMQALKELEREIANTGKASAQFRNEYNKMLNQGAEGKLNMNMVRDFQTRIKNEQASIQNEAKSNSLLREQQKLLADIARLQEKNRFKDVSANLSTIKNSVSSLPKGFENDVSNKAIIAQQQALFAREKQAYADRMRMQSQSNDLEKKRLDILNRIEALQRTTSEKTGALGYKNLSNVANLAQNMKSMEDYIKVKARMDEINRKTVQVKIDNKITEQLNNLKTAMIKFGEATGRTPELMTKRFEQIKKNVGTNLSQIENEIKTWQNKLNNFNLNDALQRKQASFVQGANNVKIKQLISARDADGLKEYIGQLERARVATLKLATDSKGVTKITAQFESAGKTAKQMTYQIDEVDKKLRFMGQADVFNRNANLGVFEQLKIAMARVPVWMASMTTFYGSINSVKAMAQEILTLDKALTELRRVASANLSLDVMFQGAVGLSKELGNNVHDVMNALNDFARTFGDFNERQLLAITKTATLMSNVSDLKADEATQSLVGTMNAFNISAEDSIHIVDALNEVDNNYAVSTKQLAEGLQKSASTAKTFGVSMEETVGHITAIGAVTMESGAIIGNSLKTIYSRITTMNDAKEILQSVGVAITDQAGDARRVNDILGDLAQRWDMLSKSEQQNIAVKVAGRYQLSRFLALMNNWDMALEATDTAVNSQGSAMRENARYMQSYEARINALKNTFTELAVAVGKAFLSGGMSGVIQLLTNIANVAVTVVNKVGALPVVFLALAGVLGKMNVGLMAGFHTRIVAGITAIQTSFTNLIKGTKGISTSMSSATSNVVQFGSRTAGSMATAEAGMGRATIASRLLGISIKSLIASTVIGAVFVALGMGIEALVNHMEKQRLKQEELEKLNKKMVDSYRQHADGMQGLIKRYEELDSKTNKTKTEQSEYAKIQKQLAEQIPTTVQYIDANGKAHMKNTEEIKKEVAEVAKLSQEQAKLKNMQFDQDLIKQADNYMKITNKIKDMQKEQERLKKLQGSPQFIQAGNMPMPIYTGGKVDTTEAVQKNKVDIMMAEAEKTEAIKKTIKAIQEQALAYFEAKGQLSSLGDAQQGVIEKFVQTNEAMLRSAKTPEAFKSAYNDLFKIGTQVGDVFVQAYQKMSKGLENDPMGLSKVKNQISDVAKSLPQTFFQMTDSMGHVTKSTDDVVRGLKEVMNVSNHVANGDSNWDALVGRLQKAGLSADEAKGFLAKLGKEHDNAAIRAEAQRQGVEGLTGSLEDLNQKTLEALDLTKTLFGYGGQDLTAMKSRIQAMELLVDVHGEGAKSTKEYQDAVGDLTDYLNISQSELEQNKDKYFDIIDALGKVDLATYTTRDNFDEFIKKQDGLTESQKNLLIEWAKTDSAKDILTGANKEVQNSQQKLQESSEKTKGIMGDIFNVEGENKVKKEIDETNKKIDESKGKAEQLGNWQTQMSLELAKTVSDWWKGVVKSFDDLKTTTSQKLEEWWNAISDWFSQLPERVSNKLGEWGNSIGQWFSEQPARWGEFLGYWWETLSLWFDTVPPKIVEKLVGWGKAFDTWIKDQNEQNKEAYGKWWDSLSEWFSSIPEKIRGKLVEWQTAITTWISEKSTEWGTNLENWWTSISDWFTTVPERIRGKLIEWSFAIASWIQEKSTEWATALDQWWTAISDWFTSIPERIRGKLIEWSFAIASWIQEKASSWGTELEQWWTSIQDWFSKLPERTSQSLSDWWTSISNWFSQTSQNWGEALENWWTGAKEWFSSLGQRQETKDAGKNVMNGIKQGLEDEKPAMLEKVASFIVDLPGYIIAVGGVLLLAVGRELIKRIITGVTETLPELLGKFEELKTEAINRVIEMIEGIGQWMSELPSRISGALSDAWNAVVEWGSNLVSSGQEKSSEFVSSVGNEVSNTPSRIGDALSGCADAVGEALSGMVQRAKDKVQEMIDGAVSVASNLGGALKGAIESGVSEFKQGLSTGIENAKRTFFGGSLDVDSEQNITRTITTEEDSIGSASETASIGGSFGASSGDSGGISSGGGGGTSGTLHQSIYDGFTDMSGNYSIIGLDDSEKLADATPWFSNEREMSKLDVSIKEIEAHMKSLNQNSRAYRMEMTKVLYLEQRRWKYLNDELWNTERRNEQIQNELQGLKNIGSQTKEQRDKYNQLWQEYEQNLSKIQSMRAEWTEFLDNWNVRFQEILINQANEIVEKYTNTINMIKAKTDNADFEIKIVEMTDPNNIYKLTNLYAEKARNAVKEQTTLVKQKQELEKTLADSDRQFGSDSKSSKDIRQKLEDVQKAWRDATISILENEQKIKDMRAKTADDSISQLKDYYGKMKDMSGKAIDEEIKSLQKASEEKQKIYDKEIESINSVYDAKMKAMDKANSEDDYQAELADKNSKRAELANKITLLSRDTSPEGKKKLADLKKQLADQDKEIADFQKSRQREMEKQALEEQKQSQLDAVGKKKDSDKEALDKATEDLNKRKEDEAKKYDNLLGNDQYWADLKDKFVKGDFSAINEEIAKMQNTIGRINDGDFEALGKGFSDFSNEAKKAMQEFNDEIVNNLLFNLKDVKEALDYINNTNYEFVADPKNGDGMPDDVKPEPPPAQPQPPQPQQPSGGGGSNNSGTATPTKGTVTGVSSDSWLNIRDNPSMNGKVIRRILNGANVQILEDDGDWWKVKFSNKNGTTTGFANKRYIKAFDTGGYTGANVPKEGALALLHEKEQVLNKDDTKNLFNTVKLVDKFKTFLPSLQRNDFAGALASAGTNIVNNYDLTVNIERLNGDKEGANTVTKEIIKGLKKLGK